jgi:VWFA-related protein
MPFRFTHLCLCASAVLSSGRGQTAPPPGGARNTPPPVIRTQANLVLVDVVVTANAKPVPDLKAGQFHIFENGKEQPISVFEEHRAGDAPQVAAQPALPPHTWSNFPRFALASAANVLLLDALNTPIADQAWVRRQMVDYLRQIPAGTQIAVFTLASRLQMIEGFTSDPGMIDAALTSKSGNPQGSALLDNPQDQDQMQNTASGMSAVDGGAMQQFLADTQSFQTDLRVRMTLNAIELLGRYLSTIPGRKNLIWFSGSFPLQIDPDPSLDPTLTTAHSPSLTNSFSPPRNYSDQVRQTDDLLAAARVAVYPVDARGLMGLASVDASRGFSASSPMPSPASASPASKRGRPAGAGNASVNGQTPAQKADARFLQQTANEHRTMQQIADETGGEAFYEDNGLKEDVAKAIENGSSYYAIGYIPGLQPGSGSFRRIQVRVDGGQYDLAYRRGYFADDASRPGPDSPGAVGPVASALQRGAPPLSQVIFEARVLPADDPAANNVKIAAGPAGELAHTLKPPVHRYLVDFAIDPHALNWSALTSGGAHAELELSMVAWDADGQRVNFTDHTYNANLDPGKVAGVLKSGLPAHQEIDLPSGVIYLRLAVHDLRTGRIGSMEIPLRVPKN